MKFNIYADNAATTRLSTKAYEKMLPYLLEEYGNASQLYSFARSPRKALQKARETIAVCIGALPEEIYFTSCGTESDNCVINGAIKQYFPIITSSIEHHAILRPCDEAEKLGISVKYLPVSDKGVVNVSLVSRMMEEPVGLLSVMFANNEIGTIQPIKALAEIAHNHGWLFHTDAVQAVGHIPINVRDLGIDMLSASAHKFNGPKGIGFLYIRKGISWPSFIKGGNQELKMRAGTENIASIVAMATALEENVSSMDVNIKHLTVLEKLLVDKLKENNIVFSRNGGDNHICGNISLSFPNQNGETIMHRLDLMGIYVSTGSACDSRDMNISHVLKAIRLEDKLAKGTIRISLGKYNTEEDVLELVEALKRIMAQ